MTIANASTYVAPTNPTGTSWQLQQMQGTQGSNGPAGTGAIAGTRTTPDTGAVPGLNAIMASVLAVTPKMTGEQLDVLVLALTSKMKDSIDASEKDKIKTDTDAKKIALAAKHEKLEEAQKKIDEAVDKAKHASIWDKIKLAFSFIGAVLTMIAAAVMIATLPIGGQIAGGMLFAAGLVMLGLAVDSAVEMGLKESGKGQFGMFGMMCRGFAKMEGKSDEEADEIATKGQMGLRIGLMGAAMLLSAPSMVIAAASIVSSAATMAVNLAETVVNLVSTVSKMAQGVEQIADTAVKVEEAAQQIATVIEKVTEMGEKIGDAASKVGKFFTGGKDAAEQMTRTARFVKIGMEAAELGVTTGSQVADATATAGSAVTHYQAQGLQSDAKTLQGEAKVFEAMQNTLDDMIDQAMARLKGSGDRFNTMLDSLVEAVKDKGDTMFHAHFRA